MNLPFDASPRAKNCLEPGPAVMVVSSESIGIENRVQEQVPRLKFFSSQDQTQFSRMSILRDRHWGAVWFNPKDERTVRFSPQPEPVKIARIRVGPEKKLAQETCKFLKTCLR